MEQQTIIFIIISLMLFSSSSVSIYFYTRPKEIAVAVQ